MQPSSELYGSCEKLSTSLLKDTMARLGSRLLDDIPMQPCWRNGSRMHSTQIVWHLLGTIANIFHAVKEPAEGWQRKVVDLRGSKQSRPNLEVTHQDT